MTERLYYHDSFLFEFDARVLAARQLAGRTALILDRSAFYPSSGGQPFDTGTLVLPGGDPENPATLRVQQVEEDEQGSVLHFVPRPLPDGTHVHGVLDITRRRDHMQQHSGQHILSAAFVRLFDLPTVSFHLGEESSTIDLAGGALPADRLLAAERLANDVVLDDRPVSIRFASRDQAEALGIRKLPEKSGEIRLIDIAGFDLTACGGTHVRSTGQVGAILLRKTENVRQGVRVEFVCGGRAVSTARDDFATLTQAAAAFSAHIRDLPQQARKSLDELKASARARHKLLEELAAFHAERMLASARATPAGRLVTQVFTDRDSAFIKLLAQKIAAAAPDAIALLAATSPQPALVFAQSPGRGPNLGALLKAVLAEAGGRGGGAADFAQGGVPPDRGSPDQLTQLLAAAAARLAG